jgi:hypothetical protein
VIFAVESVPGRALGFHVLLENGALYSQLPIHALAHGQKAPFRQLAELVRWDCFGWNISTIEFTYLREVQFIVSQEKGEIEHGRYICSIDFVDDGFSDYPEQHKMFHLVGLEDGNFALVTNDKCQAIESSFVTAPFIWDDPPKIERNRMIWHAEEIKRK